MRRHSYQRQQQRRMKADLRWQAPAAPPPPPLPQPSPEELQQAQDHRALQQAVGWGYDFEVPGSLDDAIQRLWKAARPDPNGPYRDRVDPYEEQARQAYATLARQLEAIQQRGTPNHNTEVRQ